MKKDGRKWYEIISVLRILVKTEDLVKKDGKGKMKESNKIRQ